MLLNAAETISIINRILMRKGTGVTVNPRCGVRHLCSTATLPFRFLTHICHCHSISRPIIMQRIQIANCPLTKIGLLAIADIFDSFVYLTLPNDAR